MMQENMAVWTQYPVVRLKVFWVIWNLLFADLKIQSAKLFVDMRKKFGLMRILLLNIIALMLPWNATDKSTMLVLSHHLTVNLTNIKSIWGNMLYLLQARIIVLKLIAVYILWKTSCWSPLKAPLLLFRSFAEILIFLTFHWILPDLTFGLLIYLIPVVMLMFFL